MTQFVHFADESLNENPIAREWIERVDARLAQEAQRISLETALYGASIVGPGLTLVRDAPELPSACLQLDGRS